ncbi:MAG: hypothetical protein WAM82_05765 [Thermoanaerobaculia bacterium]
MIRVQPQPEPDDFDAKVRQPGLRALTEGAGDPPPLWRDCALQLWEAYRGICSYLCVLIPRGTALRSVDHFLAKSQRRDQIYEWSNYRLACSLMNSRKREFEDVLDPFEVEAGWFVLEFSFLQILTNPNLDAATQARVQATIDRLKLNDNECLQARATYYEPYRRGLLAFEMLEWWSPFVAAELKRQGLTGDAT